MKIEVGGKYELNNGDVVECVRGPDKEGDFEMSNELYYSATGLCYGVSCKNVKRRVDVPEPPKTWGEMTDAEKGALLLARHEGKFIEWTKEGQGIWRGCPKAVGKYDDYAYRVRPEPVRGVVTGWWNGKNFHNTGNYSDRTHRITFETVDGKPDCATIKMEEL